MAVSHTNGVNDPFSAEVTVCDVFNDDDLNAVRLFMLGKNIHDKNALEEFLEEISEVALIHDITVPPSDRGKGYGAAGLDFCLDNAGEADVIFLEVEESDHNVFSLKEWYRRHGFVDISSGGEFPVYALPCSQEIEQMESFKKLQRSYVPAPTGMRP